MAAEIRRPASETFPVYIENRDEAVTERWNAVQPKNTHELVNQQVEDSEAPVFTEVHGETAVLSASWVVQGACVENLKSQQRGGKTGTDHQHPQTPVDI